MVTQNYPLFYICHVSNEFIFLMEFLRQYTYLNVLYLKQFFLQFHLPTLLIIPGKAREMQIFLHCFFILNTFVKWLLHYQMTWILRQIIKCLNTWHEISERVASGLYSLNNLQTIRICKIYKHTLNRVERQPIKWRKMFKNHNYSKGLIENIYKKSYNSATTITTTTTKIAWLKYWQ